MSVQTAHESAVPGQHRSEAKPAPLSAAKMPVGMGAAARVGVVVAVLVLALGALGIVEALLGAGVIGGSSWVGQGARRVNGLTAAAWCVPVGIGLVLLGLWLLVAAVRPRPRRVVAVTATTGVYLRPADVARLAGAVASRVDGVSAAKATATRRKVTIEAETIIADTSVVRAAIETAVSDRLQALASPPRVQATVRADGGRS